MICSCTEVHDAIFCFTSKSNVTSLPAPNLPSTSGVATGGQGGQSAPPDSEKNAKNRGKEGKIGEKGKNRDGSFTLPLLMTDRAGYATPYMTGSITSLFVY